MRLPRVGQHFLACLFVALSFATVVQAQANVSGVVRTVTGRPLENAVALLDPDGQRRTATTDAQGRFQFDRVSRGSHELRVLEVGYESWQQTISVADTVISLSIVLRRLPYTLDTMRVVARQTGVFGRVYSRVEMRPLGNATVSVMGQKWQAVASDSGQFEMLNMREGAYVLYAKAPRMRPWSLSVLVPKDSAVEVSIGLDYLSSVDTKFAQPLAEFETRVKFMNTNNSALVSRHEVAEFGKRSIGVALRFAPSLLRKGVTVGEHACVFVDGLPKPGMTIHSIDADQVESVEVYGPRSDWTNTLAQRWPPNFPCGSNSNMNAYLATAANPGGLAKRGYRPPPAGPNGVAIVIWLKR